MGIAVNLSRCEMPVVSHVNSEANLSQKPSSGGASTPILERYNMLFNTIRADTEEQRKEVFRLRYQVYCVEQSFLTASDYQDDLETDECDAHSHHVLLLHRNTNVPVGTARLVMPKLGDVSGMLPILKVCPELLDYVTFEDTAEVSRFAISKEFRRRITDGTYGQYLDPSDVNLDPRRIIPHLSLGLLATLFQFALNERRESVCAVMEPTLLRLLGRFGIDFQPVGPLIEYHGLRQPCFARLDELMASVEEKNYDLWQMITNKGKGSRSPAKRLPIQSDVLLTV